MIVYPDLVYKHVINQLYKNDNLEDILYLLSSDFIKVLFLLSKMNNF